MAPEVKPPSSVLIEDLPREYHHAAKVIAAIKGESLGAYAARRFMESVHSDAQEIMNTGLDSIFQDLLDS